MKRSTPILQILAIAGILACLVFSKSCANTTAPPEGGPKDTIPPKLLSTLPSMNSVNHPLDAKRSAVTFVFDEYVTLNEPAKNIFLSPPQQKPPTARIKGKKLVVSFADSLEKGITYSLSLGESIKDNNEGNPFPPLTISFSTGDYVDSLFVSGTVLEAATMLPVPGAKVVFHTDPSDSAVFNLMPKAAAMTDVWGYFVVRNLPAGNSYRVYAIEDLNNNNRYDPDLERIAFLDTLVLPSSVITPSSPELAVLGMKDTVACLSRPSQISLSLFKEHSTKQLIRSSGRSSRRHMYVTFMSPYPVIDSIRIAGIPSRKLLYEYSYYRDSVNIWINDQGGVRDTLTMMVSYRKTDDSLQVLVPVTDTLTMARPRGKMVENRMGNMVEEQDTLAAYTVDAAPEKIDYDGIIISFESPMISTPFDSISLTAKNPREQISNASFTVERDTSDIKRYILRLTEKLQVGYEYRLRIPDSLFLDIDGIYCDSLVKTFSLPADETLSSLTLEVNNVSDRYMLELVDEKRTNVFRTYSIDSASVLVFPYLKAGKYSLRITEDKNRNGQIDPGSILERKQPEKVMLFRFRNTLGNDAYILDVPERMELVQTIDIGELFK